MPFSEQAAADRPVSLYAATKRADEMMAHVYSHQYGMPMTGLRLFTVYGPWGRPDMAPMLFLRAMLEGRSIVLQRRGKMQRDFTYVDDVVEALVRVLDKPPAGAPPYRVLNVGRGAPVTMARFVDLLEEQLGHEGLGGAAARAAGGAGGDVRGRDGAGARDGLPSLGAAGAGARQAGGVVPGRRGLSCSGAPVVRLGRVIPR